MSWCVVAWLGVATTWAQETAVFHHENVLGTTLELQIRADSPATASAAEAAALAEIDRLSDVFSTYTPHSEFSRWQAGAAEFTSLSPEMRRVLHASDRWQAASQSAFHPGAELLSRLWKRSAERGRLPAESDLQAAVQALRAPPWEWDGSGHSARRRSNYPLTLNAIAKGDIVDQACERLLQHPGVVGAFVKIGGDLRVGGQLEQTVAIRDPQQSGDNASSVTQIRLQHQALATSGDRFRGFEIAGKRYSHLLDPRTGRPVDQLRSVTVVAPTAMDADALATACSVLSVPESLALIDSLDDTVCLLIDDVGKQHSSRGWAALAPQPDQLAFFAAEKEPKPLAKPWNGGFELAIDFELNQPEDGGRYRRPYVAVWVENAEGQPVRTLVLWVQTTGPGPRWIPDLHRWYRKDFQRRQQDETNLVATVSEPTRKAGAYQVVWDGTDQKGELLPPGKYTVFLEANRERGNYRLMRHEVAVASEPFQAKLAGNDEIKAAAVEYRRRKPTP